MEEQDDRESQKLWHSVVTALKNRDQEVATEEKFKIEDRQREEARMRESDGVEWHPRFFRAVDPTKGEESDLDWVIAAHMYTPPAPPKPPEHLLITPAVMIPPPLPIKSSKSWP